MGGSFNNPNFINQGRLLLFEGDSYGGKLFLLEGDGSDDIRKAHIEGIDWCTSLFKSVRNWKEFFKFLATLFGVFIKLGEESMNMTRVDVGRILMVVPTNNKIDHFQKVWIGDTPFNIRVVEEESIIIPYLSRTRRRNQIIDVWKGEGSDTLGSDDEEWWPENISEEGERSYSIEEDDDVASSFRSLQLNLSKSSGGGKKQLKNLNDSDIPSNFCVKDTADVAD
ncbi:hypothetical protein TanjilG_25093 [Lupinus angustifolius]|uniref:Uncharacterized protein n=1 Tax=Lupinus angustifolius TaxID=3871 RepID=A0A1J7HHT8_LUPAN|nr:hypothetical protein TanjilG_25093 [Lupinus angustifolius]